MSPNATTIDAVRHVLRAVADLRTAAVAAETEFAADLRLVDESAQVSARNLVHYIALRRHDLRPLQEMLHGELGDG